MIFPVEMIVLPLARLTQQRRRDTQAVAVRGGRRAGELGEGRQHVPESADEFAGRARLDPTRPSGEEGRADAPSYLSGTAFLRM
jgi:hypothetical protein